MKTIFLMSAIWFLVGCSSLPKVPERVLIPVPVSCIKELPSKPIFKTHDELKQLSNPDAIKQLGLEIFKYEEYVPKLEAILLACKG